MLHYLNMILYYYFYFFDNTIWIQTGPFYKRERKLMIFINFFRIYDLIILVLILNKIRYSSFDSFYILSKYLDLILHLDPLSYIYFK